LTDKIQRRFFDLKNISWYRKKWLWYRKPLVWY
jgi:hypothetical protein